MLPAVNSIDSSTALSTKITEIYPLIPLTNLLLWEVVFIVVFLVD